MIELRGNVVFRLMVLMKKCLIEMLRFLISCFPTPEKTLKSGFSYKIKSHMIRNRF